MTLPSGLRARLTLPLIAAPMTAVSGPELVIAAARHGVIASFPTHNARSTDELDQWLHLISHALRDHASSAPVAPNLVVHRTNRRLDNDLACLINHRVELVITSVGSPVPVIAPLHDIGCLVFADVATMHHAERALAAGVDGLVLLTAGAGGQTGWNNPLSFVRAVRKLYDGPLVLAGGIACGADLLAAQVLGADLAYMGTKFIATRESLATDAYRGALVGASLDDVSMTTARSGLPANLLTSWLASAPEQAGGDGERTAFSHDIVAGASEVWAAGHSVHGVDEVLPVAELIKRTTGEYDVARHQVRRLCELEPTVTISEEG